MADWLDSLARWEVFATLTFRWEASSWSAQRAYEKFMARHCPDVSYFYALEENPSRDGHHVHAIWHGTLGLHRKKAWKSWFTRYGRARIEPVRGKESVQSYCAKYVCKERVWWNVHLNNQLEIGA